MQETRKEIIHALRRFGSLNFSTLLKEVAETSDNLTYHLRYLTKQDYIESPEKGVYKLSQKGKKLINTNLDTLEGDIFPTVSVMLLISDAYGNRLFMRKHETPNLGRLHNTTFQLRSDLTVMECISAFCGTFQIKLRSIKFVSVFRKRSGDLGDIDFDKLFLVHTAHLESFYAEVRGRKFELLHKNDINDSPDLLDSAKDTSIFLDSPPIFMEKLYGLGE
jgi:DNA-binding transcriptional ArsR family regulator